MTSFLITELIVDPSTASWILNRCYEDGLHANLCIGFPYNDGGGNVCAVRLDYSADDDLEISKLLVLASERASRFDMKPTAPPQLREGAKNASL